MALEFPLLRRELVGLLRTRRAFWLLLVAVVVSALLPLIAWPAGEVGWVDAQQTLAVLLTFFLTLLTAALIIIPAFTAGAITGERERDTYELLYTTLLSPWSIVISKLLASTGYVLILLAATAPSVCVLYLLGGIGFGAILEGYAVILAAVVSTAIVCMRVSMRSRRTAHAVVRGMVWLVLWNGGLMLLIWLAVFLIWEAFGHGNFPFDEELAVFLLGLSPYPPLVMLIIPEANLSIRWISSLEAYFVYAGLLSGMNLLFLLRAVRTPDLAVSRRRERRLARQGRAGRGAKVRRALLSRLLVFLGDGGVPLLCNPVFLKEARSEFFARPWYRRAAFWGPLLLFAALSFFDDDIEARVLPAGCTALALIALLLPGTAASSIPREIEQGNLDLLRGTLVPLRQVFHGKLLAALYSVWGIVAAAGLVILVAPWLGSEVWSFNFGKESSLRGDKVEQVLWSYLACAVVIPTTLLFAGSVALFFSVISRRTLGALLGSYIVLLGIFLLMPAVLSLLAFRYGSFTTEVFLPATSPFATLVVSVVEYGNHSSQTGWNAGAVLVLFAIMYLTPAVVLLAVSAQLLERLRGRDR